MGEHAVSLDDKYSLESGRIFLTGTQALVRLPMMQRQRDAAAGLNTAAYITGYRGSPLGGVDQQMWQAKRFLEKNHIHFQPGINEDLAATAVWGSQQNTVFNDCRYDGVFAMWYAKGPGVDRSGDVLRHGNLAGTSPHGGVLLLAGDDHTAKSSTAAHQTEYAFMDAMIPTLSPAGIQELIVRSGTSTEGAEVVVVGRSNIVGKPIAVMMLQKKNGANATVTVCHTRTRDVAEHTRRADILIVAAGVKNAVTAEMVKPGATVIDVGVNRIGTTASGKAKLVGDVDFEAVKEIAAKITPVPGGVGPMTITMLLKNTVRAARLRLENGSE
jgi:TPP-dependent indolepyruvate ferredoxin oxidoreductase alpha subunit